MAKVSNREDALLQAYLSRYKAAQDSAVTGGQQSTQKAQRRGSAILNATDKTLPSLGNPYESTLKNIVGGVSTENSLNLDFMNRQVSLAKKKFDMANDYAQQLKKAQEYAEKQAKAAAKATKRRTGKGNTAGQNTSTDLSNTAANALNGLNSSGNNANSAKPNSAKPNSTTNRQKKPSAQEQYLADKASGKRKAITSNSYAERSNAAQPTQSRAVTKGGKVIGSSYAAAGNAPSASERTAAKKRQERVADSLQKLQTDASYRAELAKPGRKLDSAEVEAVNQYVKSTKNTGFSGLKRVFDLAKNSDNLSKDEYAKKSAELNAELNQNSALRSKAQGNGAGQSAQAFTAGLYDSVPFLSKASDAMASAANATGLEPELPMLTKTLEDTKTYDPVAATLGTMAGKAMQYKLFNTLAAGTKYGKAAQAVGGKIGAAAQKIPGLGALVGNGFGDAAGRVLADTGADLALDTLPSLASDVSEGKSAGEVAGNAAKNLVGNVAMNALPEIGGAVFNRIKGAAGDAAQDALKQADNAVQEAPQTAPARNIVQPDANGTTRPAAQTQQMNAPVTENRVAMDTTDELRGQVNLNGAQTEAKTAMQNSGNMPIDSNAQKGYNAIINDGGAQNGTEINVGRSVEGTEPGGAGASNRDVQGVRTDAAGDQRVFRQPVIDDAQRQTIESSGATWGNIQDTTADPQRFSKALNESIAANKHGLMVSPKSVEELQQPGTITFMGEDGLSGALVTADGDIEAVFKNPASKTKRASTQLLITAVENGGNKLDCYGAELVNTYNRFGFEPVAKVAWNPDYAPDGWTYGPKDVYVMKLQDGVDTNTVLQKLGRSEADGGFHRYTKAELDALPTMEYDEALAYRDSLLKTPSAMTEGVSVMPDTAKSAAQSLPLNGSESVPEHAVGAASTQYDRREVLNQDYANQRRFNADLEPDEVAALGADQNTHTLYTRKESADTARLNYDTYLQQGDGSISEASKAVLQDLRGKSNWNADDIALAKHAAEQQHNYLYTLEKGSDEYNLEFARYKQLDSETSRGLSGAARTLYEGREAKPNGYTGIRKFEQYTQVLTDDFAKTRDGKGLKQVADVVYNGEINDFLTQLEKENRLDEAMLEAEKQIRNAAKAKNVKISDDAVKSAAASLVAGGNADDMFNALARTKLGIGDISQEDYDFVRGVFERVADMPDSKARRELEMSAYSRLAKYMPAKSFGDKVNNIRYLCMLGNTRTHGRNILGNILMNTVVRTKDNVAGVMQLALPQDQRTKAIGTMLTADGRKMADLARDYADNKMYSVLYDNGKYNVQTGLEGARRIYKDGTIGNALESLAKVNSNALEKEDAYFLKAEFGNSMASFLKARGYDSSVFTATDDASKQVLLQAAAQALNDAKVATFHEDNFLSTALSNLSKDMRYNGGALGKLGYAIEEGILPFKKTPLNIAKNAIDYAGGSYLKAGAKALGRESATDVIDELAKGVTGSAIMGIGYILARNGFLTGGTTGDDRADAYRNMNGDQEYAVKIPGKGTYTLDWASPAAVPLLVGAEIAQDNSELTPGILLDKFRHLSQPVLETTMLQGLNDTLDNISYADSDEKLFALLAGGAGDFARQFVPTVLGQAARTIDPVRRSSYGGGQSKTERDTGYALRSTMNRIPGLSLQNEPYIDQWGREQASLDGTDNSAGGMFLRGAYNMLSPGYIRQENITPVDEYLQGLYGSTNDSGVLPEKASNSVTVDSKTYYLTPEEKTQYAKTRGQISYDAVDSLRQNSLFLQLSEDQQNEIVKDVYTVAGTAAAADTLGDGVSGTNSKAYQAYEQGGIPMLENYLLADSAIKDAGATKQADVARELLNSGLDSEGIYNSYILKYQKDQKAPAVYSQYGADGARNWLRYQAVADSNGNGRISQDEARAALDAMNLTDEQRAYYYLLTNSGWSAKNNPYGGA